MKTYLKKTSAGFTVVELALVIAILAILGAIAVPKMFEVREYQDDFYLQDAVSAIRYAQKLAVSSRCPTVVSINAQTLLVQQTALLPDDANCDIAGNLTPIPHPLPGGDAGYVPALTSPDLSVTSIRSLGVNSGTLVFDRLGRARPNIAYDPNDMTVTINTSTAPRTITVTGEGGLIQLN